MPSRLLQVYVCCRGHVHAHSASADTSQLDLFTFKVTALIIILNSIKWAVALMYRYIYQLTFNESVLLKAAECSVIGCSLHWVTDVQMCVRGSETQTFSQADSERAVSLVPCRVLGYSVCFYELSPEHGHVHHPVSFSPPALLTHCWLWALNVPVLFLIYL